MSRERFYNNEDDSGSVNQYKAYKLQETYTCKALGTKVHSVSYWARKGLCWRVPWTSNRCDPIHYNRNVLCIQSQPIDRNRTTLLANAAAVKPNLRPVHWSKWQDPRTVNPTNRMVTLGVPLKVQRKPWKIARFRIWVIWFSAVLVSSWHAWTISILIVTLSRTMIPRGSRLLIEKSGLGEIASVIWQA